MHVFKFGAMLVRSWGTAADFSLGLVIQSFNAPSAMCTCFVLVYQWFWTMGDGDTLWRLHCTFFFRDNQQQRTAAQHAHELHRQAWSMGERARTRAWVASAPVFGHRRSYLRAPMAASGRPPRPGEPATNRQQKRDLEDPKITQKLLSSSGKP